MTKTLMGSIGSAAIAAAVILAAAPTVEAAMTRASAEAMMKSGRNLKCSVSMQESGATQTGEVYFSQGKMRGDFKMVQPGEGAFDAHVLQDGEWSYTWGGPMGGAQGTKIRAAEAGGGSGSGRDAFDTSEEVDMDCTEWTSDPSKFRVPAGVDFMDLSGMAGAAGAMGNSMAAMQCQACDQVPEGPERQMCRQMMGCA